MFARHCHPLSAWSRWATTPLTLLPFWTRRWRDAAVVGAWFALNPVVFGKPRDTTAWASRAMLGEEHWIGERPRDAAMAVNAAATLAGVLAAAGAWRRRPALAAGAMAVQMGLLMAYWELMVRHHEAVTR
ncbi:hypothetical protein GCM10010171_60610 [Actinokineospora fastidiosa]|uniref:Uncharacterized protein n=1 Tax=Actinokineospora fastidiosa TaxID=1816 RepID=A0A918GTM5_9PSEU|nr:hypothetical protein GCM10010171_60610 [Actinokineospora fastidiosa]